MHLHQWIEEEKLSNSDQKDIESNNLLCPIQMHTLPSMLIAGCGISGKMSFIDPIHGGLIPEPVQRDRRFWSMRGNWKPKRDNSTKATLGDISCPNASNVASN
jgi:hypothetical protein